MSDLVRFGVSIDEKLLKKYDDLIGDTYNNRSEAIRDLIRDKLVEKKWQDSEEEVVGSLTLVFDHHQRELTEKMLHLQHDYHHLFESNLHVHFNHDFCLEVIVVKGKASELQEVTRKLLSLKGVHHGKLALTSSGEEFK